MDKNTIIEDINFKNNSNHIISLKDIAINTPFNDNYPNSKTCYLARTHAHIWAGNHNAYINAIHMSGNSPHLGLVLTKGSIVSYEISERSIEKGSSNFRGVIALNPEDLIIEPGKSYSLQWRLFTHTGWDDFFKKLVIYGSVVGKSKQYVYEIGDTARVEFQHNGKINTPTVTVNGKSIKSISSNKRTLIEYPVTSSGEMTFRLNYNQGKTTFVQCLGVSNKKDLIKRRVDFIIDKQQYNNPNDSRNGAYMVYDNDLNMIILNEINQKNVQT